MMMDPVSLQALHHSIKHGDVDAVRRFIKAGGSVKPTGRREWSPLGMAADCGHSPIIALLLDAGADVNEGWPGAHTPLMLAATSGSTPAVRLLIERGAKTDCGGIPAHQLLVQLGHGNKKSMVELLRSVEQ